RIHFASVTNCAQPDDFLAGLAHIRRAGRTPTRLLLCMESSSPSGETALSLARKPPTSLIGGFSHLSAAGKKGRRRSVGVEHLGGPRQLPRPAHCVVLRPDAAEPAVAPLLCVHQHVQASRVNE